MTDNDDHAFERRKAPRIHLAAKLRTLDGDETPIEAFVVNLSASGALVDMPGPVEVGKYYALKLILPNKVIRTKVEVVRCYIFIPPNLSIDEEKACLRYRAGLQFRNTHARDVEYLEQFVAECALPTE